MYRVFFISTAQDGRTPLICAAMGGYTNVVQELMKHGASVNAQDGVSQKLCVLSSLHIRICHLY